jgi:hypothetical protein
MPEIPDPLKWYTPLKLGYPTEPPTWRMSVDKNTSGIAIKRVFMLRPHILLVTFLMGTIGIGMCFVFYAFDLIGADEKPALIAWIIFLLPAALFIVMLLDIFAVWNCSRYWKGSLRFRFNPQNGELFFSRENVTYGAGDYTKLIFCCIRGATMAGAVKRRNEWFDCIGEELLKQGTQIYMLVLDNNSEWQRYNLADDVVKWKTSESGSKQFLQLADLLRQHLSFETFVKDYSLDECYEQQR